MKKINLEDRLKERGILIKDLIDTALKMYIEDPKIGDREKVKKILHKEFQKVFKDINVYSLIIAGFCLEDELRKGMIPGLSKERYSEDPVELIADEMLGIQIAEYIGGSRALFEFERFDKKKPGILRKLPPILDDIIGGLISGVLVKVCSK